MTQFLVVAQEIETGKSFRASIELDSREEAERSMLMLVNFSSQRYTFSILEYEA